MYSKWQSEGKQIEKEQLRVCCHVRQVVVCQRVGRLFTAKQTDSERSCNHQVGRERPGGHMRVF